MNKALLAFSFLGVAAPTPVMAQSFLDVFEKVIGVASPSSSNSKSSQSNSSANRSDGTKRYDVSTFDVAGVRLGMSPAQVRAALIEKGFTISERGNVPTFQEAVDARARQLNRSAPTFPKVTGPGSIEGYDSDRNRITVEFLGTRETVVAAGVYLKLDGQTVAASQIWADLKSKYGVPSADDFPVAYNWCDIQDPSGCGPGASAKAAKLNFRQVVFGFTLELTNYVMVKERQKAEIAALFPAPDGKRQRGLLGGM